MEAINFLEMLEVIAAIGRPLQFAANQAAVRHVAGGLRLCAKLQTYDE